MRFALLGNHPDATAAAAALTAAGHKLVATCEAPPSGGRAYADLEDLLADPEVETVIVAGPLDRRFEQLRRVIQSERGAFCVHPCDEKLDRAYEAAWMQKEANTVLLPLLPDGLHPAFARVADVVREWGGLTLLKWDGPAGTGNDGAFAGWTALRRIGGEIIEVSGFGPAEGGSTAAASLFNGRFEGGGLLQATILPAGTGPRLRLSAMGRGGTADLDGPDANGAAVLRITPAGGETTEERWAEWDRWAAWATAPDRVSWQDAVRALELDDALAYSVDKGKVSGLDYQDMSPDTAGKGKITLIGCGMIWMILLVFVLSIWAPWIRWAVVPMLLGFFALLAIRWIGTTGRTG